MDPRTSSPVVTDVLGAIVAADDAARAEALARAAIIAGSGSAERVLMLIARLDAERRSVPRAAPQRINAEVAPRTGFDGAAPQPAE
jgi:hypothetical protein